MSCPHQSCSGQCPECEAGKTDHPASEPVFAWHFLAADKRLAHTNEPVEVGRVYTVKPPIVPCERGLHGSTIRHDDPHVPKRVRAGQSKARTKP